MDVQAVSQVLVVVFCGVVLSKTGYLSQSAQKSISRVNLYFMTPCLLFTKIASTINWTQFKAFWPIPAFYVLFSAISWIVAKVGSRFLRFSKDEEKFIIASVLFSNTNSLPMALLQSLAFSAAGDRLLRDEFDTKADVAARGISYILFYAIFGNLVRWSYGFNLLVPKDKGSETSSPEQLLAPSVVINVDRPSASRRSDASVLTLPSDYQQLRLSNADQSGVLFEPTSTMKPLSVPNNSSSFLHPLSQPAGSPAARSPAVSIKSATESVLLQRASTAYERVRQVLTPPLLTALIALVIGLVPALHKLFMSPDSTVYRFLVQPIEGCGAAAIPMILLCLGAQVVHFGDSTSASAKSSSSRHHKARAVDSPMSFPTVVTAQGPYQTGLGIYTNAQQEEVSTDEERGNSGSSSNQEDTSYGSGIATRRSNASSSATLLLPNHALNSARRSRSGAGSSSEESSDDEDDDEALPLLGSGKGTEEAHHRFRCITPVAFSLFARMVLVPVACMPSILFHPESLSPILTMDPTFTLALVLIAAAPTAINMIQICQIKGFFEREMASVLFWSYCVYGIPSVLGWSLVGLWAAGRE
ncbi:hypothetical protein BGZ75_007613 [Mortierella antarctica]|nr:hypothetical protein BGZ75_007613 [Mortierella antarctica]